MTTPAVATVQALKIIRRGINGWHVLDCGGYEPTFVRAVQLIDACRQLGVDATDVLKAGHARLDRKWLADVIEASSELADSPKETELRLIIAEIAERFDLVLQEQVPVYLGDEWVTTLDLALTKPGTDLKLGLMYDGAHHIGQEQWMKDNLINLKCAKAGWDLQRITKRTLREVYDLVVTLVTRELGLEAEPPGQSG
ncbi:hypothetical protein JKI95_08680 [Corynebacterium aquatimens]|uniref:hypothetical protein n=2 Tax=Corynebacterium TaxID=1716 RepID=UPI0025411AAE|nr:hypothetical protein [Corynebacterium aquatimens]QYH19256.1 hypothetical protein JKI95_08680 [Corynebacterium aquatimens]